MKEVQNRVMRFIPCRRIINIVRDIAEVETRLHTNHKRHLHIVPLRICAKKFLFLYGVFNEIATYYTVSAMVTCPNSGQCRHYGGMRSIGGCAQIIPGERNSAHIGFSVWMHNRAARNSLNQSERAFG